MDRTEISKCSHIFNQKILNLIEEIIIKVQTLLDASRIATNKNFQATLHLKKDSTPKLSPTYSIPYALCQKVKDYVNRLDTSELASYRSGSKPERVVWHLHRLTYRFEFSARYRTVSNPDNRKATTEAKNTTFLDVISVGRSSLDDHICSLNQDFIKIIGKRTITQVIQM
ncbi:hypothetical protein RF11_03936 [Thelohanellus kitauei]|uniref:Uncharacterized protein n=1 Tax=Thelohanellus kitauei TaxID=669202 RepID=A0A0C2N2L2_THEKT|nr:hypothetical protein RF11_03936 [Thelohanellus kitauei]